MPADNRKQFNIHSDEAYEIAHELAAALDASATEIVVAALREYKAAQRRPARGLTPEQAEANCRAIMKGVAEARRRFPPTKPWNAEGLYDEHGAPK